MFLGYISLRIRTTTPFIQSARNRRTSLLTHHSSSKRDLLKRHAACHESDENSGGKRQGRSMNLAPRVSQACKPCAAAKLKCDEGQTCRRCLSKGLVCRRESRQME